ncbi:MAG: ATP synthase F0 subunit B [Microcystaceae cyanobacterium]
MARKHSSSLTNPSQPSSPVSIDSPNDEVNLRQRIEDLEDSILECFRVPLTKWTIIDEERILDQIELIKDSIPEAINKALAILREEQQIRVTAQTHYEEMIASAQQQAAEILDQTGIIQQAEAEATSIRQQVQSECETIQQTTLQEIEQMRKITIQEMSQHRQQVLAESDEMQRGADEYVDHRLAHLEHRLGEILHEFTQVMHEVRNGRQRIQGNSLAQQAIPPKITPKNGKSGGKKPRA